MTMSLEVSLYEAIRDDVPLDTISNLIKQGVDCNLSHFDPNNLNFISPIQLAAGKSVYKYGALHLLYRNRNSPTKMQIEKHLAFYFNYYDSSNNEKNDLFLEFNISRLFHARISQYLPGEMDVINVALWNYDKVLLHGRQLNIGLTYDAFLKVRIYTLFRWLAEMRADSSLIHNSTAYAIIENELLHHLEAYYLLHDIRHIPVEFTKDMMRSKLNKEKSFRLLVLECYKDIAQNIIKKIKELQPKEEYIIPTGWDGHAVCITFRRIDQTHISIRVDNPSPFNPPKRHEIKPIARGAGVHRIRSKVLGLLDVANLDKNINYFMLLVDSMKRNLDEKTGIRLLYNSGRKIKGLEQRNDEAPTIIEQASTNCVVKCFEPGLRMRCGKQYERLCETLLKQEKITIIELMDKCKKYWEDDINGIPDQFDLFRKIDTIKILPAAPNFSLHEKLKSSYKRRYQHISNIINEQSSHRLEETFIDLKFKEEETIIQFEDLFSKPRILILGEAGSGKTTICQYAAYSWACGTLWQNQFGWLFYIKMRNLNENIYPSRQENYTLIDIIINECYKGSTFIDIDRRKLEFQFAHSSKILWILDGYDERIIPSHLSNIEQELLSKANLLLTSRPYGTHRCHYDMKVNIQGFTDDDIKTYIEKYFYLKRTTAQQCKTFVFHSDQLQKVACIPVCLQLICILWNSNHTKELDTIEKAGQLYEKICEYLLRRYLLKFHGLCTSALASKDVFEHPKAEAFKLLEYLAFIAAQSNKFATSGEQIWNITGRLCMDVLQSGLLKQKSGYHSPILAENVYYFIHRSFQEYLCGRYMRRELTLNCVKKQKEVIRFIADHKYFRRMRQTFQFFFDLDRSDSCMKEFWSAVDCEPRDLIGLRHFSRMMQWVLDGTCVLETGDKKNIDRRTIDVIKRWILNKDRRPHDSANIYLFEWSIGVISKQVWLDAFKEDLFIENSSKRRYFMPGLWSETNIHELRNIYGQIPKDVQKIFALIKNGPTERVLRSLQIDTDKFPPPIFPKQKSIPKWLQEVHNKAKQNEAIMTLEEFQTILHNYSSYAELNCRTTILDIHTWPLKIDPSALIDISQETLKLILELSQENALFYRDFKLPIISFLQLYENSDDQNEILCSLIVSIALNSPCIVTASPGRQTSVRVHEHENFVDIDLGAIRRSKLLLEFDKIRQIYGYSYDF
ncbi:unnamed protein product [Rotaria sordida]|uniref:NACHT domain-containing protein n=1 Tax=Rotaria sordida TaxID=392033 RepID=A0A816BBH8_9BILA|nr:unnamed protein product [Rotaria sordida]CAF1605554.1 unnamed protein product [Rotaria sordida]